MIRFYLVDDSPAVLHVLGLIIRDRALGEVCGSAESALDALEDLPRLRPDVVVADMLMPRMDGITFVRRAKPLLPDAAFVMLSQVSSKEIISSAYEGGVEFFVQKPVNAVEVESVLRQVIQSLQMRRTLSQMRSLMGVPHAPHAPDAVPPSGVEPERAAPPVSDVRRRGEELLRRIGILGEPGSRDLLALTEHLAAHPEDAELSLTELCGKVGGPAKTVEQRIRRAALAGLTSLAGLGVEDYANEVFAEYAGALYSFEQVRREMDFIRGKTPFHGRVQVRRFLAALVSCASVTQL